MPEIIDVHTHFGFANVGKKLGIPGDIYKAVKVGRNIVSSYAGLPAVGYAEIGDFDVQMEANAKAGVTRRLMSSGFTAETFSRETPKPPSEVAKVVNEEMAALIERAPDKLYGMGTANALDKGCVAESERAISEYGFKGVCCTTSWHGKFIDNEEAYPFWEWAAGTGTPIFLHPPRVPIGHETQMDQYKLDELVGRPFDTAMGLARMILSGLFDRFPKLQLCVAHMGGGLLPVMGRLDFGWRLGCDGMPERSKIRCKELPSSYLRKNIHVDTMGFWGPHVREALEVFGPDRVMFGTDYGPVPLDPKEHIDIVKSMGLGKDEEEKVFWKNASAFFKLGL
jgi:aminocarboxymuconate-semialdehyde decarboxylase